MSAEPRPSVPRARRVTQGPWALGATCTGLPRQPHPLPADQAMASLPRGHPWARDTSVHGYRWMYSQAPLEEASKEPSNPTFLHPSLSPRSGHQVDVETVSGPRRPSCSMGPACAVQGQGACWGRTRTSHPPESKAKASVHTRDGKEPEKPFPARAPPPRSGQL